MSRLLEDAVDSTLLVLTSAPDEPRATSCLRLVRTLRQAGEDVEVLLMQDGVLLATQRPAGGRDPLDEVIREGVRFLVLEDDLRLRGFGKDDLVTPAHLVSYRMAIRRMAEEGNRARGCF